MSDHTFKTGDRCGVYRIVRFLGSGRSAEVYEATRDETGQRVAIRCLRATHRNSEPLARRLIEETAILAQVRHTNVTAVLGAGSQGGAPFAALEHVKGKTLRERLDAARGPTSTAISLCFARQIADGAAALHAAGAVHGELRPESIRLTDIDEVKLCDVGRGTPIRSPGRGEEQDDIRAVGLMLAEMLLGRRVSAATLLGDRKGVPPYIWPLLERSVLAGANGGAFASMTEMSRAIDEAWSRLLQDSRKGVELRRALNMLTGMLQAMGSSTDEESAGMSSRDRDSAEGEDQEGKSKVESEDTSTVEPADGESSR